MTSFECSDNSHKLLGFLWNVDPTLQCSHAALSKISMDDRSYQLVRRCFLPSRWFLTPSRFRRPSQFFSHESYEDARPKDNFRERDNSIKDHKAEKTCGLVLNACRWQWFRKSVGNFSISKHKVQRIE